MTKKINTNFASKAFSTLIALSAFGIILSSILNISASAQTATQSSSQTGTELCEKMKQKAPEALNKINEKKSSLDSRFQLIIDKVNAKTEIDQTSKDAIISTINQRKAEVLANLNQKVDAVTKLQTADCANFDASAVKQEIKKAREENIQERKEFRQELRSEIKDARRQN